MKKKIALSFLILLVIAAYFTWSYITTSHGDQKVIYEPSKKECFTSQSGKWKSCWRGRNLKGPISPMCRSHGPVSTRRSSMGPEFELIFNNGYFI